MCLQGRTLTPFPIPPHPLAPLSEDSSSQGNAVSVAATVQHFITTMDTLKLNMIAVDQVYPLLSDLVQSLHKVRAGWGAGVCGDVSLGRWGLMRLMELPR